MQNINSRLYKSEVIALRIKKRFFDDIESGVKTQEYRLATKYYAKLFAAKTEALFLHLHYQKVERLLVAVKSIKKIKTPRKLKSGSFGCAKFIYKIELGKVKSFKGPIKYSTK